MVSFSLLSLFSAIQMGFSTGYTFLERCNFSLKTRIFKNKWHYLCNISGRVNLAVKVILYAVQGSGAGNHEDKAQGVNAPICTKTPSSLTGALKVGER